MPPRSKIEIRLAVMKRRLELIQKAMKEEQASLEQARKNSSVAPYAVPPRSKPRRKQGTRPPSERGEIGCHQLL